MKGEAAQTTAVGGHPDRAVASFQQIVDGRRWQAVVEAVGDKALGVEPAQSIARAKPEKPLESRLMQSAFDYLLASSPSDG